MTTPDAAARSTRPLSEVARHIVVPSGIVDTLWFDVEERCREFGDEFDAWQDGLGQLALGLRADGMFAATVGGVTLSIPRQVAKTFIVMRIVVALCTLFDDLTVIWTAHRLRTANHTFAKMKSLALRPEVRTHVRPGSNQGTAIRDANGEQQIPFKNGSVIMFGAREQGFGRGFDEVDIEVFDEAQILTEKALEDMVAATNQSRFKHGALLFYMGTPPRPIDPGEAFTLRRKEALEFKDGLEPFTAPVEGEDALYVECSADSDADVNDRKQWALANPSFPHRTPLVSLQRLRKNLPNDDSWRREALGVWDAEADVDNPFAGWLSLTDEDSEPTSESIRLALDAPHDLTSATFSIAGTRPDGVPHVSMRFHVEPERMVELVSIAKRLSEGHNTPVIVAKSSPAHVLIPDLEREGVEVDEMTAADAVAAFNYIAMRTRTASLRHRNQPILNEAIGGMTIRRVADVDRPARRTSSTNIAPFIAAMCALYRVPTATPKSKIEAAFAVT